MRNHAAATCSPHQDDHLNRGQRQSFTCHVVTIFLPHRDNLSQWHYTLATTPWHPYVVPRGKVCCHYLLWIRLVAPWRFIHRIMVPVWLQSLVDFLLALGYFFFNLQTFITSSLLIHFWCPLYPCEGGNMLYNYVKSYITNLIHVLIC